MRHFPDPQNLTVKQLQDLYRLKRFDEWLSLLEILDLCDRETIGHLIPESLKPDSPVRRDIGALAFIQEFREFMVGAEEHLKLLSGTGGTQNERTF